MANSWIADDQKLEAGNVSVGDGATDTVVSKAFRVTAGGAARMKIGVKIDNTGGGNVSYKLQYAALDGETYEDAKTSANKTDDGWLFLDWLGPDETTGALLGGTARIAVSTAGGTTAEIESVLIWQEN
jgi:hypothetical protein